MSSLSPTSASGSPEV
ncbi:unnamed protein product, partial [Rotaria sp. Silwood1]